MKISVLCINLKVDLKFTREFLKWDNRKVAVYDCIRSLNPDIVLAQEISEPIAQDLRKDLAKNYELLISFRDSKEKKREAVGVLLKKRIFSNIHLETYWLTNTPVVTSKFKTSLKPRIATVVKAMINNQELLMVSTHLDPLFPWVRNKQMQCLAQTIDFNNVFVLGGDFNGHYNEKWFTHVQKQLQWVKPYNMHNTLHYGKGRIKLDKKPIDYVFVQKDTTILQSTIIDHPYNGIYPSDHFPIYLIVNYH